MLVEKIENKKQFEKKIFFTREDIPTSKNQGILSILVWSWQTVKKVVALLFVLQVVVYILALWPSIKQFMLTIVDPLLLVVDFFYVGWILVKLKLVYHRNLWQSELALFMLGGTLGVLVSWFKLIWIRQPWTVVNLIIEPFFMGGLAVAAGLVLWWLIRLK